MTLFFCFLNQEVRNTVKHHWIRWRTNRGLDQSSSATNRRRGTDTSNNICLRNHTKDGSGRALSESARCVPKHLYVAIHLPIINTQLVVALNGLSLRSIKKHARTNDVLLSLSRKLIFSPFLLPVCILDCTAVFKTATTSATSP